MHKVLGIISVMLLASSMIPLAVKAADGDSKQVTRTLQRSLHESEYSALGIPEELLLQFALEDSQDRGAQPAPAAQKAVEKKMLTSYEAAEIIRKESDLVYAQIPLYREINVQLSSLEGTKEHYEENGTLAFYEKEHAQLEQQKKNIYEIFIADKINPHRFLKKHYPHLSDREIQLVLEELGL